MSDEHRRLGELNWTGGLRFLARKPGGPTVLIDGDGVEGPSPVVTLLLAAGACSGADVVSILEKGKVKLNSCKVEVSGQRREDYPRRFTAVHLVFRLAGDGLTEANTKRAVELSVTKYCSVVLSLNPDIGVTTEIVIE